MIKRGTIKGEPSAQEYNQKQNKTMFAKTAVLVAAIATASNAIDLMHCEDDDNREQFSQWLQLKDLAFQYSSTIDRALNCFLLQEYEETPTCQNLAEGGGLEMYRQRVSGLLRLCGE